MTVDSADLAREVAELRNVVLRMLDIMEDDKIRSMRYWAVFCVAMFIASIVVVVIG